MPRGTKFAIGWALAAVLAIALSWTAVAQVRNRVIQPSTPIPPSTLAFGGETTGAETSSPPVIRLEPEPETTTTLDPSLPTTIVPPATATGSTEDGQTTASTSPGTTSPGTSSTSTTTTTGATTSTTTSTSQPPSTTTSAPPETLTSSYQVVGGTVTISYSPGVVNFVSAIPQPGFSTDLRDTGPDRVRVRFESEDHVSEFRAEWEGGELRITKDEDGED